MKKITLLILLFTLLYCTPQKSQWEILAEKEKKEIESGVKVDSVFLGIKFGITHDEFIDKLTKLQEEGKLSDTNGLFEYIFKFDYPKEVLVNFQSEYFSDSLYQLSLIVNENSQTTCELIQLKLVGLMIEKYGTPLKMKNILDETKDDYVWIKGNLKIEIDYPFLGNLRVKYIDMILNEKQKKFETTQQQKNKEDILNNI